MEIGERLKEAREEQNLSLESLQETTKIQKRYLEAIEQGNFKILPGTFYARAFIKEYAAAVGLDPNELLEEYKEEIPQAEEESTVQYSHIHRSRKNNNAQKNTNIFSFIPTVIVVLLVIGIFFVVWLFYQETASEEITEPEQPQDDQEVTYDDDGDNQENKGSGDESDAASDSESENSGDKSTEGESEKSKPEFVVEEKGTGSPPESTVTLENASDEITATIEASGDSWLDVQNDAGESLFSGMVSADNSPVEVDLAGADRVWFSVGSAPALDITIDGTALEYPVNPDEEVFQKVWVKINKAGE
ncbi:MAG TPA: helix-turn-helix domain-containing protein [Lentibacillus sp.]|uniref:helix-turn-helix domain-containing protein n=1 Tax=Lentibacillus sp. TaxID=1925746 RepID=UPI002B4B5FB1|nr:helix-turn-helix domain-containing protein [Lentibacillus sp.]HLR61876.1 helix-turn-helix domain-containing protein [Lentibacillus sp.]